MTFHELGERRFFSRAEAFGQSLVGFGLKEHQWAALGGRGAALAAEPARGIRMGSRAPASLTVKLVIVLAVATSAIYEQTAP